MERDLDTSSFEGEAAPLSGSVILVVDPDELVKTVRRILALRSRREH